MYLRKAEGSGEAGAFRFFGMMPRSERLDGVDELFQG